MIQGDEDRTQGWDDQPLETQRLDLDDDKQLPWLASADDDEDEYAPGNGRLIVLALVGLVAIAGLAGGAWWLSRGGADEAVVADGSTIAAPETPYKEKPGDPGGKTFAGTGDTSYAVSEGQNRPAKLEQGGDTAPAPSAAPSAAPSEKAAAVTPVASGVGVQIGAYSSQALADAAWARLSSQYEALSGVSHRVQQGKADIGTVYRLQAVAGDAAAANALCSKLKAAGLACQVKQ